MKSAEWWADNWHNHELIKAEGKSLFNASASEPQPNEQGGDASKEPNQEERVRVETFALIREIHRKGGDAGDKFSRPRAKRVNGSWSEELMLHAGIMALKAKSYGYATETRGRKKKHTDAKLLDLLNAVEKLKSQMLPGTSDKKAIEESLMRMFKGSGQREGRVYSKETQAKIKTVLSLLSMARKLMG